MRNRRRVVYYAILLLLILGELLEEINYIIIIFPEYNTKTLIKKTGIEETNNKRYQLQRAERILKSKLGKKVKTFRDTKDSR